MEFFGKNSFKTRNASEIFRLTQQILTDFRIEKAFSHKTKMHTPDFSVCIFLKNLAEV